MTALSMDPLELESVAIGAVLMKVEVTDGGERHSAGSSTSTLSFGLLPVGEKPVRRTHVCGIRVDPLDEVIV